MPKQAPAPERKIAACTATIGMVGQACERHSGAVQAMKQQGDTRALERTRMCKFFAKGQCTRGRACTFAHAGEQLQPQPDLYRTQLCRDLARTGTCRAGGACSFAHSREELRRSPPRKDVPPSVSASQAAQLIDASSVGRQIALVQHEAMQLQVQLRALQREAGVSAVGVDREDLKSALKRVQVEDLGTPTKPSSDLGELADLGFSRQSTQEGDAPAVGFSRQSSAESDIWEEASVGGPADGGWPSVALGMSIGAVHRAGAPAGFALVVKNTFLEVQPDASVADALPRRAKSVPAATAIGGRGRVE